MKIAVLGERRNGFVKPMSLGLVAMLERLAEQPVFFDHGLAMLDYKAGYDIKIRLRNAAKNIVNHIKPRSFELQQNVSRDEVRAFEQQMTEFDLIVVVCPLPKSFIASELPGIERLRQNCKAPIVLYQNYYLATRGDWFDKIRDPANYGGGFGLERFDWYLGASLVSEYALTQKEHPFTLIGHDLRDESLRIIKKSEFRVLLDFPQTGFEMYRQVQKQALEEAGIPYTELTGRYSADEIRALYRSHCALLLSFRESFGLPIVENQLCGNLIFTPYRRWVPSHFIGKSPYDEGEGRLGENFVVYDNNVELLKSLLLKHKSRYNAEHNLACFRADYPQLYNGDLLALQQMLGSVKSGKIHHLSHQSYRGLLG